MPQIYLKSTSSGVARVAMLPLTPPSDTLDSFDLSAEVISREDGLIVGSQYQAQEEYTVATPVSIDEMVVESTDDRDTGERFGTEDLSDDDSDMSDGGADISTNSPPTMVQAAKDSLYGFVGTSHEGHLHAQNNGLGQSHYPTFLNDELQSEVQLPDQNQDVEDSPQNLEDEFSSIWSTLNAQLGNEQTESSHMQDVVSDLPGVISELSQQLQHIQDGQEHEEFGNASDQSWAADHSIPPFPSLSHSIMEVGSFLDEQFSNAYLDNPSIDSALLSQGTELPQLGPDVPVVGHQSSFTSLAQALVLPLHFPSLEPDWDEDALDSEADQLQVEDQYNYTFGEFLTAWSAGLTIRDGSKRRSRVPRLSAIVEQSDRRNLEPMEPCFLQGDRCDIQRFNWEEMGVTRVAVREGRRQIYRNYTNLRATHHPQPNSIIPVVDHHDFFKFRRMDFKHHVHQSHFQLRNLIACPSRDHILYAGRSKVMHYNPAEGSGLSDRYSVAMDLTKPTVQSFYGMSNGRIQISTLTVAHNILVAGGFCGEYGIANLNANKDSKHIEGILTEDQNGITNHVQVHLSRSSSNPLAAFASNDKGVRIVDITTNKIIADHQFDHPINCTAISPDQRLRVLTGDSTKVLICNSENGEVLQELEGHRDYGFACDWADDGWSVATGNQDMLVNIWDARKWTDRHGIATPVATIASEMAGIRKLKFSPLGSGKKVLVAAEPADSVHIIDAETYTNKQTLGFFGDIGGFDFTNNGRDLIIANCDHMRGGIMEFERCGLADDAFYDPDEFLLYYDRPGVSPPSREGYDWIPDEDALSRHPKFRGTKTHRRRRAGTLVNELDIF